MRGLNKKGIPYVLIFPSIAIMCILLVYPFFRTFQISFLEYTLYSKNRPFVGFNNYIRIFSSPLFIKVLSNSFVWSLGSTFSSMLFGLGVALLLNRPFKGKNIVRSLLLIAWVIPVVVAAILWKAIYSPLFGPLNDFLLRLGVIDEYIDWLGNLNSAMGACIFVNLWHTFPFFTLMITAGFQNILSVLYEAAAVDGASAWHKFRYITLPEIRIILTITGILCFIWSMNAFAFLYTFTGGGPMYATTIIPLQIWRTAFEDRLFGEAAAAAIIMFFIIAGGVFVWFRISKGES